jgi:peptidoglycan/LPS O-acetylase OafA/YrhL
LYLVHQNIGYVVISQLSRRGVEINAAIGVAIVAVVGLASAVTFLVERPACAWARELVKRRRAGGSREEHRGVRGLSEGTEDVLGAEMRRSL